MQVVPPLRSIRAVVAIPVLSVIAFSVALNGAASAASARCFRPSYYKTVLKMDSVRVVKRRVHRQSNWMGYRWLYYGCHRSRGEWIRLGLTYNSQEDHGFSMRSFKSAGPYVGFIWNSEGEFDSIAGVRSVNLRTGATRDFSPYAAPEELGYVEYARVERYVLRPTGAFAWVTDTSLAVNARWGPGVFAFDTTGLRRLDERTGQVDRTSLRLTGSTVTWREAGLLKSAPLD